MFLIAIRNMSPWKDAMVIFCHHHINNMGLTLKSYIASLDSSTLVQVHRTSHNIVVLHIISYPLDNLIFCSLVINCQLPCVCQRTDSAYLAIQIAFPIFQHLSTLRLCKKTFTQYLPSYVHQKSICIQICAYKCVQILSPQVTHLCSDDCHFKVSNI